MQWHICLNLAVIILATLPFVLTQDSISRDKDSYGKDDPFGTPYQTYLSNPNVRPPQLQINSNQSGLAPGYVFIGVDGVNGKPTSGQNWPVIFDMSEDRMGTLVWTGNYAEPFDFRAQTYKGEQVLTFSSGELLNGYGHGSYYILNQSYAEIAHFSAVGFENLGDLHEFTITSDDTAIVIIYHSIEANLTPVGGADNGWIFECTFQEINIETGSLIFEWNASAHVSINETYNNVTDVGTEESPFDWFHMNSVEKDVNGDYLISGRVMDCLYKISGEDGHIIWRLHGKQSDFDVEDAANFVFQHDARWIDDYQTRLTIFDNGPTDEVSYSRGLLLAVDQSAMNVRLIQEYTNSGKTFAPYEGSLQAIHPDDERTNYFIGFGSQPFFAEVDHAGNVLLDVQFSANDTVNSYRAYKLGWQGKPLTKPDIHFDKNGKKAYFSWNGATDVESWIVYTANSTNTTAWTYVTSTRRTGFETTIDLSNVDLQTYIRGQAVNSAGAALGWTQAGDGTNLFDAPNAVNDTTSSGLSGSSTTLMSSTTPTSSGWTMGAVLRLAQIFKEQVYVVAMVGFRDLIAV